MRITTAFLSVLAAAFLVSAQQPPKQIPDEDAYVLISKDGHFTLNGKRIRFWGCTGGFSLFNRGIKDRDPYRDVDLIVDRLKELGFNMIKYSGRGSDSLAAKGDSSQGDISDYLFYKLKKSGFKVWNTSLRGGRATPEDADIIKDSATAEAWKAAIAWASSRVIVCRRARSRCQLAIKLCAMRYSHAEKGAPRST